MNKKKDMPEWVYWGLWGIKSRKTAWVFCWVCILLALVSMLLALFFERKIWAGGLLFLAAGWYWASIKWVDENSSWE